MEVNIKSCCCCHCFCCAEQPGFVTTNIERITAIAGEVTVAYIGTSVEYTADALPDGIILHAELDPALLVNGSVTFTWFKDRIEVTQLSFFSIVYTIATETFYSRLFIRIRGAYPVTGTYTCLIENTFMSEVVVGMEVVQSTICESLIY